MNTYESLRKVAESRHDDLIAKVAADVSEAANDGKFYHHVKYVLTTDKCMAIASWAKQQGFTVRYDLSKRTVYIEWI